ncbi:ribose-5-phosphate isomerase RpiA [Rappaport israeli]|uniref:ribose-5-phosphate isomerase RpiA n=1 Tax=Rappaport israeli TaxID=1839807 RepID=UPI0009314882|nr:ribose-5-phosphate isomerase RpiA [Rappaport israeli]
MKQAILKEKAAKKALDFVQEGMTLGVGSGSTVRFFIQALADSGIRPKDIVAASKDSEEALASVGLKVRDLNSCDEVDVYVDGCDEINERFEMIKGGGAALTREKIIAAASAKFVCIADASKQVSVLGEFALPVEVIPMARSYVARQLLALGGEPRWREGVVTDNGNWILDVHYLSIVDAPAMEQKINAIAGVVTVGIFAKERADVLIVARENGVEVIER